jgi:OOP family OmpA-OmpF porin
MGVFIVKFKTSIQVIVAALPLLATHPAWSDAQDGDLYISPMLSFIDANSERLYDNDRGISLDVGGAISEKWNFEVGLRKLTPEGIGAQDQTELDFDFQRVFRRTARFSPYVLFGVGVIDAELDALPVDDSSASYSIGAGFTADIFGDARAALRVEYRSRYDDLFSMRGDDDIVSIGLQFPFGGRPAPVVAPAVDPDTDGDGVPDSADRCPNTPRGQTVDADGCTIVIDDDRDGVPNAMDRCPNTMAGVAVDANGCEVDADGDGVVDRLDRCPGTRAGAVVDVNGCEIRDEITLPGVNFETNSDRLLPEAVGVLAEATQTLLRNPQLVVEVAGHTDSDGAADYNLDLSNRRAAAVRQFFIDRGVPADQLSARGYGETQPIAENNTSTGKAQNRRVVLRVLSGN